MTVFLCENGMEGILCGIFAAYESRLDLTDCRLDLKQEYELQLFAEYREIPVDLEKAQRVEKKIRSFMSEEAYFRLYRVSLHKDSERANWIFKFVQLGLCYGKRVLKMLQEEAVYKIFRMDRYVGNEAHLLREFARFERLANGVYYGIVGPENQVLELVAVHFADRFPDMDWILYDENHRMAALHVSSGQMIMKRGVTDEEQNWIENQRGEDMFTDMWKVFFHTIAIEERRNPKCQRNMLPLRYRKYMTEFCDSGVGNPHL